MMYPRERFLAALSLKVPDRVPKDMTFNREVLKSIQKRVGVNDLSEYFNLEHRAVDFSSTKVELKNRFYSFHHDLSESVFFTEWGTAHVTGSMSAFDHFIAPLTGNISVKDIQNYPLPDFNEDYRHQDLEERVAHIHKQELAVMGACGHIFEESWQIRGFNDLMTDFLLNEDRASCLLDRVTELRCFQARRYAEAGVDAIQTGDDVGMQDRLMMSLETWRKWLKPRLAKVIKSARKVKPKILVRYHSDGCIEPIIPDLIEIGVNVLNPVQPECMDPAGIKKKYGDYLAFWGTVGTQTTMPFGNPEEIKKVVKERIKIVGKNGGLLISPTHTIEPEVPWKNILAFFEAVEEFGEY